jgi:hypothetical protein
VRLRPLGSALVATIALVSSAFASGACTSAEERACRVGADCASGVCGPDGVCAGDGASAPPGPGGPGARGPDAGDGGATADDGGGDAALAGCVPNHDGTIARDEVPLAAGLRATFRVARNADFTTAGVTGPGGTETWDLSVAFPNDANVLVETDALDGKWFSATFPGASYASTLSASSNLIGVFEISPSALVLRGVVSPDDGLAKTELTNSPAAAILSFPLKLGATWTTTANVTGTASGYPAVYTEQYDSKVDAEGALVTPLGTFDVLRVAVVLTRTVGVVPTVTRSFAFVSECYGTVATITSNAGEAAPEFTHAAEIRRIAP